jgi:hypothetical protein
VTEQPLDGDDFRQGGDGLPEGGDWSVRLMVTKTIASKFGLTASAQRWLGSAR